MLRRRRKDRDKPVISREKILQGLIDDGTLLRHPKRMESEHIRTLVYLERANCVRHDTETIRLIEDGPLEGSKLSPCARLFFAEPLADTAQFRNLIFGDAQHMLESGNVKIHYNVNGNVMISRLFVIPRDRNAIQKDFNWETDVRSAVQMWDTYINKDTRSSRLSNFNTDPPEYLQKLTRHQISTLSRLPFQSEDSFVSFGSSKRLGSTMKGMNSFRFVGLAVLINGKYSHIVDESLPLLEREMRDLQQALFMALCGDKQLFHYLTAVACKRFHKNVTSYHNALRFNRFASISLNSFFSYSSPAADHYFADLADLISRFETKDSGYFLSKLLSAVFMYHLTWVTSTKDVLKHLPDKIWGLSEFHQNFAKPLMNALGCVGMLSHTTRIVLIGKDTKLLSKLLHVLSFFVRVDRFPFDSTEVDAKRKPFFDVNRIWPLTVYEKEAKLSKTSRRSKIETEVYSPKDLDALAARWQTGGCSALFAQKTKLREACTNTKWEVDYNLDENITQQRHRAHSEPHQHLANLEDPKTDSFRPRSSSNPISKFNSFKPPQQEIQPKKVPVEVSTAHGQLPYGVSLPVHSCFRKKYRTVEEAGYEEGEADAVFNFQPAPGLGTATEADMYLDEIFNNEFSVQVIINHLRSALLERMKDQKNLGAEEARPVLQSEINRLTQIASENMWIFSEADEFVESGVTFEGASDSSRSNTAMQRRNSVDGSPIHGRTTTVKSPKNMRRQRPLNIQFQDPVAMMQLMGSLTERGKPLRAPRSRSITDIAKAMAKNTINLDDPLNMFDEDEVYNDILNRLREIEDAVDKYADYVSSVEDVQSNLLLKHLFGGVLEKFEPGFVVQALDSTVVNKQELETMLRKEVQHPESFYITVPKEQEKTGQQKRTTKKTRNMDEYDKKEVDYIQMTSVIIAADVDTQKISIFSGDVHTIQMEEMAYPCDSILSMLERIKTRQSSGVSSNQELLYILKATLESLVRRASQLHHYVLNTGCESDTVIARGSTVVHNRAHQKLMNELSHRHKAASEHRIREFRIKNEKSSTDRITASHLVKLMNCQYSDLRLLINIASVLSPLVRAAVCPN